MTTKAENFEGGIKIELITNKNEIQDIIDSIICCICLDLVKIPLECSQCEALYCKDCWEGIKVTRKKCAFGCSSEIKTVKRFFKEKVLSKVRLHCEHCHNTNIDYNIYLKHIQYCKQHLKFTNIKELKQLVTEKDIKISELLNELNQK
jgi:hypothetical protein